MANSYRLWFRDKYQLAPTDPRYLAATDEMIQSEYWAYWYEKNPRVEEFEDTEFDQSAYLREIEQRAEEAAEAARISGAAGAQAALAEKGRPEENAAIDLVGVSVDASGVGDWEEIDV